MNNGNVWVTNVYPSLRFYEQFPDDVSDANQIIETSINEDLRIKWKMHKTNL